MGISDEDLVVRHLNGDPEAFEELVRRYAGRLYSLAFRYTGEREQAQDIAQESLLRAHTALPRSQTDRPFRPWLYRIAVNLCRDWGRREKRRALRFSELEGPGEPSSSPVDDVPDEEPWPLDQLEARELQGALQGAMGALREEDRVLISLRYNEGLSYSEIGVILNVPPATVGTNLFRSKRKLRAALAGFARGGDGA